MDATDDVDGRRCGDLVVDRSTAPAGGEQAVGPHEVQVLAARRRGDAQGLGQVPDGQIPLHEPLGDLKPVGMGEHPQGRGDTLENRERGAFDLFYF